MVGLVLCNVRVHRLDGGWWTVDGGRWMVDGGWWTVDGGRWKVEDGSVANGSKIFHGDMMSFGGFSCNDG